MNYSKKLIGIVALALISLTVNAQQRELSWEELREVHTFPEWYTQARFGIWTHWGAQTQPRLGGGWYARNMYMQDVGREQFGRNAYSYHLENYGHPSEIGYKDVIHSWKGENLDTDSLMAYFKSLGAQFFMALANHHDRFDNFESTHFAWNSVNIGPKRDIIGEFEKSARKYGLPFGVSSHDDRFLHWWLPAFGADTVGPYKGIPYDGHMTKEDGIGKWWEGLDPAELYGLPPDKRTPEWIEEVKHNYMLRHIELVTKYDVDMLWVDGIGMPYDEYGREVFRRLFNNALARDGKITTVGVGKIDDEPMIVKDVESGAANEIIPEPWQSIITFTHWFYKEDDELTHNARTVIEMMSDVISKNGNLILNVELLPDGTIPPDHKPILDEIGEWININAEAIFASNAWKIYGDNLHSHLGLSKRELRNVDIEALQQLDQSEHYNQRTVNSPPFGHDEVRFTVKGDDLFVFILNPVKGNINLPSLGLRSDFDVNKISSVTMVGADEKIRFRQRNNHLTLTIPEDRPTNYALVLKVEGAL